MKIRVTSICVAILFSFPALVSKAQSEFANSTIQVGVVVSDLDRAVKFYTEVIGMQKVRDFDINSDFGARSGLSGGVPFHVEVLKLENKPEATEWKLLSFGKDAQHPKQKWIQDDTGMQYITIYVNSLDPFIDRLESNKVPLLGQTPTAINEELWFVLVQDPDGNFVELIGPPLKD